MLTLTGQAEAFAKTHFGISASASPLPGEVDLNFQLTAGDGKRYVLKLRDAHKAAVPLSFEAALLAHLAEAQLPFATPQLLGTAPGTNTEAGTEIEIEIEIEACTFNGAPTTARLLSWVNGTPLRELQHRPTPFLEAWGACCGQVASALANFEHPGAHRDTNWDPRRVRILLQPRLPHIVDADDRACIDYWLETFQGLQLDNHPQLRRSVCHHDMHEDNLLYARDTETLDARLCGLVDVGDALYTYTISELAVASAYAMMDQPDPIGALTAMVRGYRRHFNILEAEAELLFPLVIGRLLLTVSAAAEARKEDASNVYRSVSEQQALTLLHRLRDENSPSALHIVVMHACGYDGTGQAARYAAWANSNPPLVDLIAHRDQHVVPLDLSVTSKMLGNYSRYEELYLFDRRIGRILEDAGAFFGYGGYLETRPFYTTYIFQRAGNDGPRWRTNHLGLDLWCVAGSMIRAPLAGTVFGLANNGNGGGRDYGPTIILRHDIDTPKGPLTFYTLYGHLADDSPRQLTVGDTVEAGEPIARVGASWENGGWPPHLHFQVMLHLLGNVSDFPGVCFPEEVEFWGSLCPDPHPFAGLAPYDAKLPAPESLLARRKRLLGRGYSLSYRNPLHMVRGRGSFLLDHTGRRYLDCVNNVAHVGHEHPAVVEAGRSQMAILNTNTRYLHPAMTGFAERLLATLPPELAVVHIVNSGSEANELALRMAREVTQQQDIIAVEGGYHGNTGGTIDVSGYKFDGQGGRGAPASTHVVPLPDVYRGEHRDEATAGPAYAKYVDAVIAQLAGDGRAPAAFLTEGILSCGGQVVLPKGYLESAFAKTRAAGGLCIVDEVQTGVGRVGAHWWAFEEHGVVPDIVTIGKPIGNGHPLGVVVCTRAVADAFAAGGMEYFNTFGGNPVSCAIGSAVLDAVTEEGLRQNAVATGQLLIEGLRELQQRHELIGDVRGRGLFIGVELVRNSQTLEPAAREATYITETLRERGVLLSTDGPLHNVLKIKPPLVFGQLETEQLLSELTRTLTNLK